MCLSLLVARGVLAEYVFVFPYDYTVEAFKKAYGSCDEGSVKFALYKRKDYGKVYVAKGVLDGSKISFFIVKDKNHKPERLKKYFVQKEGEEVPVELPKKVFFAELQRMSNGVFQLIKNKNPKYCKVNVSFF